MKDAITKAKKEIILMGYFFDEWLDTYKEELRLFLNKKNTTITLIQSTKEFNVFSNANHSICRTIYSNFNAEDINNKQKISEDILLNIANSPSQLNIYYCDAPFLYKLIKIDNEYTYKLYSLSNTELEVEFTTEIPNKDINHYLSKSSKAFISQLHDKELVI